MSYQQRRRAPYIAAIAACALVIPACGSDASGDETPANAEPEETSQAEDWPTSDLTWVVPTGAGGALDTATRLVQKYVEEELGVSLIVENREGGNFATGTQSVLNDAKSEECETFITHSLPTLPFASYLQDVDYSYDDFYPIAGWVIEPRMIAVHQDSPWTNMEELIQAAKDRPGEITVSVANTIGIDMVVIVELETATGADFNVVSYDGGNNSRNALQAQEVDATTAGLFALQPYTDDLRLLGIMGENKWTHVSDVESIQDQLDIESREILSVYGAFVNKACHENHPERYEKLTNAFLSSIENQEYLDELTELEIIDQVQYTSPDDVDALVQSDIEWIEKALEDNPEAFQE